MGRANAAAFNVVPGWSPITVEVKGDGTREAECTGETDMCWDGIRPEDEAKPYGCRSCVTFFTLDEVTLEPEGVA